MCNQIRLSASELCLDVLGYRVGKRGKSLISKYDRLVWIAYEPRGRGFKSWRARQSNGGLCEEQRPSASSALPRFRTERPDFCFQQLQPAVPEAELAEMPRGLE